MNHISELEGQLARFGDLDIGIVINNAGSVSVGQYINVKGTHLISDLIVDLYAVFTLNRILLPKMRAREHRSAIINISSVTGVYLSGLLGVYSSAKMALDIYSRILAL
jgi:short-subunit dehydrogenase